MNITTYFQIYEIATHQPIKAEKQEDDTTEPSALQFDTREEAEKHFETLKNKKKYSIVEHRVNG